MAFSCGSNSSDVSNGCVLNIFQFDIYDADEKKNNFSRKNIIWPAQKDLSWVIQKKGFYLFEIK